MDKTFRPFVNQKVPDMGVIGGKFRHFFPENWVIDRLKMGKTLHPTPHTPHPAPTNKLFQQTLIISLG
ncbi:hypothetical protein [Microcystis aeruginosa]|uniref:hypothetical protein n=1 Tax=Microcystis aeruginosa TaxID=1126 RepID=UPI0012DA8A45|nr:hypothetical protein [Microcystis aeruginosa]